MVTLNSASFLRDVGGTLATRLAWARNIVFLDLQADASWATNDSYYVELEIGIFDINNLSFTQLGKSLIEEPNSEGGVDFEVQQIMQDYEGINIPVPDFNATQIVQHTTPTFYIKIYEVVNNVKTQIALDAMTGAVENQYFLIDAIDAALDRENFTYEQQYDWIFGELNEGGRKFLTSVEDPKSTTKKANEFLYWFGSQPNRDLEVYCKINYDDDTEETVTLFNYLAGYHIQCIPTRYDLIKDKSTQPTKKIIAWGVYAGYNTFRVSEYFRYELHEQQNREAKYFLAKNSLGVFDTLVCAGDYEEFLESESETASKRDFANYAITDAQKFIISKSSKRGGNANTAFLNRLQSVVKQDFTLSREMLLQSDKGFIPIVAEKIKQVYSIKNNNLIGYSFEYAHAHNVKHYTNKIFRPILGEVPTPPELPKFTIKNTGEGYVRVEYNATTVDVEPNTEENIEIEANASVKVTWSIINLDTELLDSNRVNINFPSYKFPPRIDVAIFDSVVQNGDIISAIPDENNIKQAREFTFTMPSANYSAEIKFKSILVIDFDFENPVCTDNAANNTLVTTVKDTQSVFTSTQVTPSKRVLLQNNELISDGIASEILPRRSNNDGIPISVYQTILAVGKILGVGANNDFYPRANNLAHYDAQNPIGFLNRNFRSTWSTLTQGFGAVSFENNFGYRQDIGTPNPAGDPVPAFDITVNLNKDIYTRFALNYNALSRCNNTNYIQPNIVVSPLVNNIYLLFTQTTAGGATAKRVFFAEKLTQAELNALEAKFIEKYNL